MGSVLVSALFLGACDTSIKDILGNGPPKIDIGDYDNQWEEWNRQNMPNYKLRLVYIDSGGSKKAIIMVRNGIPESSNPPEWLTSGEKSTVPDFFSFIKEEEKGIMNTNASLHLDAVYNTVYHYPSIICKTRGGNPNYTWYEPYWDWNIDLILMVENQQEAWDRLNILDYEFHLRYFDPRTNLTLKKAIVMVKNGIPESSDPPEWLTSGEMATVSDFFFLLLRKRKQDWRILYSPQRTMSVSFMILYITIQRKFQQTTDGVLILYRQGKPNEGK